jgi:hypothetical protein
MIVETGPRLAPASAFDAERLDTFKIGRVMRFRPVDEADRKDVRQWWACINRALKVSKTPWQNAQQASEAITLALGIVNLGKTVGGQWMQFPKSLNDLDEAELADAVRDMKDLLHKITGVDPDDWHRETADVGEDEQEPSESSPPPEETDAGSGTSSHPPGETAPDHSASGGPVVDGAEPDEDEAPSTDAAKVRLFMMAECVDNFLRDATSMPSADRQAKVNKLKGVWNRELPNDLRFVGLCHRTAEKLIENPSNKPKAEEYLKGLVK